MGKKAQAHSSVPNPLEAIKSIGSELSDSVVNDLAKGGAGDFFRQLLGDNFGSSPKQPSEKILDKGKKQLEQLDPRAGAVELFNAKQHGKAETHPQKKQSVEKPKAHAEASIDYHREVVKSSERASRVEVRDLNEKIQQITIELRRLISSSKVLQMEFAEVSVEQTPTNVGEYHVNFLEWMLIVIKSAREKVEDSGAWLNTIKGKSGKKGYWGMFKKHGTTFGLSNERAVSTQTG
jgi:hypothetical protein